MPPRTQARQKNIKPAVMGRPPKINMVIRRDPIVCGVCRGRGHLPDNEQCGNCQGTGQTGETPITIGDVIVENIRGGNYVETAAALVDVHKVNLYEWLRTGAKINLAVENEQRSRQSLTAQEKRLSDFHYSVTRAVAEAESAGQAGILAAGRLRQSTTVTKSTTKMVNGERTVETTTTVSDQPPDWKALAWHQERRFSRMWARREQVEVTGEDGGPVQVDVTHRVDELADRIRRAREGGMEAIDAAAVELEHPNDEEGDTDDNNDRDV